MMSTVCMDRYARQVRVLRMLDSSVYVECMHHIHVCVLCVCMCVCVVYVNACVVFLCMGALPW